MIHTVENYQIDAINCQLSKHGQVLAVKPKVFDLLLYLIVQRDRVVTREELFKEIWLGRPVSSATLANHINFARQIFGDNGQDQRYIRTVHGRGYQFVAPCSTPADTAPIPQTSPPLNTPQKPLKKSTFIIVSSGIVSLVVISLIFYYSLANTHRFNPKNEVPPSLLILPFDDYASASASNDFARGLNENLTSQFSKIKNIRIIYKKNSLSEDESSTDKVLEGSVQIDKEKIRVNVRLFKAKNDTNLWASTYTRDLSTANMLTLQHDIAVRISKNLETALSRLAKNKLHKLPTNNMAALEYFLKAKAVISVNKSKKNRIKAISYLEQAILLDKNFPDALGMLALHYINELEFGAPNINSQLSKSRTLVQHALKLEPTLCSALLAQAKLFDLDGNHGAADDLFNIAITKNPNIAMPYSNYGIFLLRTMRSPVKALILLKKAEEMDPNNEEHKTSIAEALYAQGKLKKSELN